jgi:outer membrane protein
MRHKVKILLLALVLLSAQLVQAQEKRSLGLKEAIDLSIKNSKQLKIDSARIEEATASLKEAVQRRLPDAKVAGAYLRLSSAHIDMKAPQNGTGGGGGSSAPPQVTQAMYGILNLSLPIYTGGKIKYGIESSQFLEQAAKLDAETQKDEVISNTVEAYINLFKARSAVDMLNENLSQAQQRVKDFRSLEKNGLLARNDLMKAELQVSNTELSLLDMENNWQLANLNMNLMLGLPEKTILLTDSSMLARSLTVKNLDNYIQDAILHRKDIVAMDLRKQAAETGVKATKADYLPNVALTGGYIAANVPEAFSIVNAVNMGVGISYNIGSLWKTKAKVQGAEARVKQLAISEDLLNEQVRLQVNRSYLNWISSQKKIEVYAKAIEQANENYRIVKNKYENSLATMTELLDADLAQLQAKLNYVFAKADALVAYNELNQAAGTIDQAN